MRKRGERTLKELYDLTDRISEPEITPVLEGSCRIQGPADESEQELPTTNSGIFPTEKRFMFVNENIHTRAESGTCNVCSAPCSSCMHLNRTASVMESKIECSFSDNIFGRKEADSCSSIGADELPFYKSRKCIDHQLAASETCNLLSVSSSHDSYSENESKAILRAYAIYDASDAVDMPPKVSSSAVVGDDQLLPKKTNVTAHSLFSSHSCITPDIRRKTTSSREEQRGSECHGDNISCITGVRDANAEELYHNMDLHKKDAACSAASTSSLLAKGVEDVGQAEPARGFHDHEIKESQSNSRRPTTCHKESFRKKNAGSSSANAGFSEKSEIVEFSPSERIPLKVHSPPHFQKGCSFPHDTDSKDLERNTDIQFQVEPSDCSMENVESSLGGQFADGNVSGQKWTALPDSEDSNAGHIKSDNSSAALKDTDPCLETEFGMDSKIPSDGVVKCITLNEQHENPISFMEASNMQGPHMQPQSTLEGENSESDNELDDVKVCDICGDAGREELLAICSRCNDGAEHTYCMREMLDKLPEGDWLCEECKTNDTESRKADKSETVRSEKCSNKNDQNYVSNFNPKPLPKLDTKAVDPEAAVAIKGLQSQQISATWHADNQVDSSISSKKASEASGGSIETASPRKKTVLSRESSFKKLDTGKVKAVNMGSSCGGQSANNSLAFSRVQNSLGSNSLNVQVQLQSPRVSVSRSNSFSNANLKHSPKVKQLIENVPHKLKIARETASGDTRKEGLVRTLTKSASLKTMSSGRSNIEPVYKTQTLNPSRGRDPSGLKHVKERNVIEKNISSIHDRPLVSPSQVASVGGPLPKGDLKVAHDGKINNAPELKTLSISKGSVDANGCKEVKKQSSYLSKTIGSQSFKGFCNAEDQKPSQVPKEGVCASSAASVRSSSKAESFLQHGVFQATDSMLRDDKTKESTLFSSAKLPVSGGNRILRCQRCNETGHVTQFCPIDKLSVSALKPSAERNIREVVKKSNKWKDAVEATNLKSGIQKKKRLPAQTEFTMPSENLSCEVASKDILSSSSSCRRDLPFLERTTDDQETLRTSDADPSKTANVIDIRQQAMRPVEASYVPTESDVDVVLTISDESNVKSSIQTIPDQALIRVNSLRASAIPELEFIWQGGFELFRTGTVPELFDGIQAHLSSCVSPNVLELVTKFPCKVQVEEVPCTTSWPLQFHEISPKEDNIALFFFAKDVESYEKNYRKLLENMLTNDLALKGNIDGVELLVFPSNILPTNSQRWNSLFFLWGVFRGRRRNCVEALRVSQKKPCGSIFKTDPLVQDLPTSPINDVSNFQKIESCESPEMELSKCNRSSKTEAVMRTTSVDCWHISSSGVNDRTCNTGVPPLVGNSLYEAGTENKLLSERTSCSFPLRCSLENMNQLPSLLGSCPKTRLQLSIKTLCQEGNIDATYQENLSADSEGLKVAEPPTHVHSNYVQASIRALPVYADSPTSRQGAEGSRIEEKMREKGKSIKIEAALVDDPRESMIGIDHLSMASMPNRKRTHSCFLETVPQASGGEASNSTDETKPSEERENCVSIEDGREHKKMKASCEGHATSSSRDEHLSGKPSTSTVHPLVASFLNEEQHSGGVCTETAMPERCFFSVDLGPVRDTKPDKLIHVLSSDDEDSPESNAPNLELALWGKEKSAKYDRTQDLPPRHAADEDASASSLSLSLALPSSGAVPILRTEQLMPDRPDINTSLFLFGGFPDT